MRNMRSTSYERGKRGGRNYAQSRRHYVVAGIERFGTAHDTGLGLLLRGPEPAEERSEHDDDELLVDRAHLAAVAVLWLHGGVRRGRAAQRRRYRRCRARVLRQS